MRSRAARLFVHPHMVSKLYFDKKKLAFIQDLEYYLNTRSLQNAFMLSSFCMQKLIAIKIVENKCEMGDRAHILSDFMIAHHLLFCFIICALRLDRSMVLRVELIL